MSSEYVGENAVKYLCKTFEKIESENIFRVKLGGRKEGQAPEEYRAMVGIAGYSEDVRKNGGKIGILKEKKGSVSLYGDVQPDYCIILNINNKLTVFPIDEETTAQMKGIGESILTVVSNNWAKATSINILFKDIRSGDDAIRLLNEEIISKVNNGDYSARLGKWVSKKSYDRSIKKVDADKMAIAHDIAHPEEDTMNAMPIGTNVEELEFIAGDPNDDKDHIMKAIQENNTTTMEFNDIILQHDVFGKEVRFKKVKSSYAFLAGTSFSARINLLIFRHQSPEK